MSEQKTNNSRRQLLKNIGLSVAAGAVVAGTTTAVQASTTETDKKDPKTKKGITKPNIFVITTIPYKRSLK